MIWLYIILFLILIGGCIAWAVWKAPSDVDFVGRRTGIILIMGG